MAARDYDVITDPSYPTKAAATFTVEFVPSDEAPVRIVLGGPCPRCEEQMVQVHPLFIVKGVEEIDEATAVGLWELAGTDVPDQWDIPMSCACGEAHATRPEGAIGCGAYWGLTVERHVDPTP